jgi:hypothetical protein
MSAGYSESTRGFRGLLNLREDRHATVFLADFDLPDTDVAGIRADLDGAHTRPLFVRLGDRARPLDAALAEAGIDPARDYVSVQALTCTEAGLVAANELFDSIARGDFARVELPPRELGFRPEQATLLLGVVMRADYGEQERIAGLFFGLLGRRTPYDVIVRTPGAELTVRDTAPWFDLAGRLQPGERRILPGGEAAYVGAAVEGTFTIDGAILAVPQRPHAAGMAARLLPLGAQLAASPVTLRVRSGRVEQVMGAGPGAGLLAHLLDDEAYRDVTEVGVSFNHACGRYEHGWAAACNEGRPGVHVGLGGDPDPESDKASARALVHVDLMAATTEVTVNGQLFMKTAR